jgi:FKBP-type peptidyl-prolyl cis-trans isomerase 2
MSEEQPTSQTTKTPPMIQEGDFIELSYTGRTAEGDVFDTTNPLVASQEGLDQNKTYTPVIVCLGQGHLLPGLDRQLIGKPLGTHSLTVTEEDAFGKKNAKLLQLIPRRVFKEQQVQPVPGMSITVDDQQGIIRSASGGRIIVDFNHPLAGKTLVYQVEILRLITDAKEQLAAYLQLIGLPYKKLSVEQDKATITTAYELPEQLTNIIKNKIVELTNIKIAEFVAQQQLTTPKSAPVTVTHSQPKVSDDDLSKNSLSDKEPEQEEKDKA